MWRVLSDSWGDARSDCRGEGMQDMTAIRVSVVPPDFVSLLCSGAWFYNSCKYV